MAIEFFGRSIYTIVLKDTAYSIVKSKHNGNLGKTLLTPFRYELSADGDYYTVSGNRTYNGEIEIPGVFEGIPVSRVSGFQDQYDITKVTIWGDARVADYSFAGCRNLQEVIGIISVGRYAFQNCPNLYSVRNPLYHLGDGSFYGCSALDNIIIDSSVSVIPVDCFNGCTNLTRLYYIGTEAQWKAITIQSGNDALNNVEIIYHKHTYEGEIVIEPGCYTDGSRERICQECGAKIVETIPAGHKWGEWDITLEPTCTTAGEEKRYCSQCEMHEAKGIDPLGHTWEEWYKAKDPTCTKAGEEKRYCPQCKTYETRGIDPLGHEWGEWYITKEPTDTENGESRRDCQRCGHTEIEEIDTMLQFDLLDDGTYEVSAGNNKISGDIVIPSNYKGVKVTKIKARAFQNNRDITSVVIRDGGVTSIGEYAFGYCYSLKSVVIGNSVTAIGRYAFYYCYALTSVVMGDSVASIGSYAFNTCIKLSSVVLGADLTFIGSYAFQSCYDLDKVYYKGTKEDWGKVSIGEKNPSILAQNKYYYYSETAPTTDGNYWHYSITGQVIEWGAECETCTWQEATCTTPKTCSVCGKTEGEPLGHSWGAWRTTKEPTTTEDGVKERTCSRCGDVETVTIKLNGSVISSNGLLFIPLENNTYAVDTAILDISGTVIIPSEVLGKAVTQIRSYCFTDCASIKEVILPDTITTIGEGAFYQSSVKSINIPSGVTHIGRECFYEAKSLSSVKFGENINLFEIPYGCFKYCSALNITQIPNGVIHIGDYAFYGCATGGSLTISESVISIGEGAFQYCSKLKKVTIGEGCEYIFDGAFYGCASLENVSIPASVRYIGYGAFADCCTNKENTSLKITVAAGNTVYKVVNGCLVKIESNGNEVSYGNQNSEIPSDANSIGSGAFYGGTYAAPIKIPLSVTTIKPLAFLKCENLVIFVEAPSKPSEWADDWCDDSIVEVIWGYKEDDAIYLVTESGEFLTDDQGNLLII